MFFWAWENVGGELFKNKKGEQKTHTKMKHEIRGEEIIPKLFTYIWLSFMVNAGNW